MKFSKIPQLLVVTAALCLSFWASADTYNYDALSRLITVAYTSGGGQTYSYDSAGNRLALVITAPPDPGSSTTTTTTTSTTSTTTTTVSSTTTTTQAGGGALSYPLLLAPGWNLLGNSLNQSIPVAGVYGDPAVVTTVWKWDVANAGWQFYAPSMDATALQTYTAGKGYGLLSEINPGEGYWVNAKLAASLGTQTGAAFALAAANLQPGWNLVATGNDVSPSVFNLSLSATPPGPGTVPINLTTLWAWDNPLSQWYFYAPSLEANGGLPGYISGKGYLDFTAGSKTLGNGMGFWVNRP